MTWNCSHRSQKITTRAQSHTFKLCRCRCRHTQTHRTQFHVQQSSHHKRDRNETGNGAGGGLVSSTPEHSQMEQHMRMFYIDVMSI